jgi:GntR family transcriptional regulator
MKNNNEIFENVISKNSPLPYYVQLKNILQNLIAEGVIIKQIPSEGIIAEKYHVSRATVRQALKLCEEEGLIIKRKGKNSCILPNPKMVRDYSYKIISFSEEMRIKGMKASSKVLRFEVIPADSRLASALELEKGEEVVLLDRIRYGDNEPSNLSLSCIPYKFCPGILEKDFSVNSLYLALNADYGYDLAFSHRYFESVMPTKQEAQDLGISIDTPLLLVDGVTYLADCTPIEYYEMKFRGDKSRFFIRVIR